jgi:hypothetical protein
MERTGPDWRDDGRLLNPLTCSGLSIQDPRSNLTQAAAARLPGLVRGEETAFLCR